MTQDAGEEQKRGDWLEKGGLCRWGKNAPCKSSRQRLLETVQVGRGKKLGIWYFSWTCILVIAVFFTKVFFTFYSAPLSPLFFWFLLSLCNCYYEVLHTFFFLPQKWTPEFSFVLVRRSMVKHHPSSQGRTPENGERNRDRSSWSSGDTWLVRRAINEIWIVRVELRTEMGKNLGWRSPNLALNLAGV